MTDTLTFTELMEAINHRPGIHDIACPLCGPGRHAPANRVRKVLRVWNVSPGFISYVCARCGSSGYVRDRGLSRINSHTFARVSAEAEARKHAAEAAQLSKAQRLWRARQPVQGSVAEPYLRKARAYYGPLPQTLGFLPARGDFPPAMIAAFALADEPQPDAIVLPENKIAGVHLTRLLPDGSNRERGERAKIMVGHSKGFPIVLAPHTDGLALAITEGIEDALSAHEATGLCAWAAGSASRLPALADAVPAWIECITILADNDSDGRRHAAALADLLKQKHVEVRLIVLGEPETSAA